MKMWLEYSKKIIYSVHESPRQWTEICPSRTGFNYTALPQIMRYTCVIIFTKYWRVVCQYSVV